jgi:ATP-binding cassette subfamily F protein uup
MAPDEGSVRLGANLQIIRLDQSRHSLDPTATLAEVITGGGGSAVTINGETRHVVSYMKDFLFPPEKARTPVSVLSGGERARLILARELARPSNLLVLDEPTNDLDLETLDLLQELLSDYPGTILLVSHDRDFLDKMASSVLMAEGNGKWVEYAGGYSDMLAQRGAGIEAPSVRRAPPQPSPPSAEPAKVKRKLSFKEKHALGTLPHRIAVLHTEIEELEAKLGDTSLYGRDSKRYDEAAERLAAARYELTDCEDEWLRLELLREELQG